MVKVFHCNKILLLVLICIGFCSRAGAVEYNVGAYYYPWYGGGGFHEGPSKTLRWHLVPQQQPALGWYDDHNPAVISQHFRWAKASGIDFFVCSYWGEGGGDDWTIQNRMFTSPDIGNVKLCVFLEPSINSSNAASQTEYLCDNYFNRPNYYKIDGKPVIYIYVTRAMTTSELTAYINNVRTAASNKGVSEVYIVGDEVFGSPPGGVADRIRLMNAITCYDTYGHMGGNKYVTNSKLNSWKTTNDSWKTVANSVGADFIPCITPGFNDTGVRSGHAPTSDKLVSDAGAWGSLFSGLIDKAVQSLDRNTIQITSWNEWHEDTQIEPVAVSATTNVVDGTGTALTNGINYQGYDTLYLELLANKLSSTIYPPDVPGAINITTTNLRWTWRDDVLNETGYKVYADPGAGPPTTLRATTSTNINYWDYTGLTPNTRYAFQAAATKSGVDSLKTSNFATYTLADSPTLGYNVICNKEINTYYPKGTVFTFSNPTGFGTGGAYKVSNFRYAWNTSATYSWTGNESYWNNGVVNRTLNSSSNYYLHLRSYNVAGVTNGATLDYGPFHVDATLPVTTASPVSGAYNASVNVILTASEAATIYYTTDDSVPDTSSAVYNAPIPLNADTTLKFFAVDAMGNSESTKKQAVYKILAENGSIAAARQLTEGDPVRLGGKSLYLKSGSYGYIEETNRTSGIRIQGSLSSASEGSLVCITGTLQKPASSECYVQVDTITPYAVSVLKPLGMNNNSLKFSLMEALYVTIWGEVKSISPDGSLIISDGSSDTGIRVFPIVSSTVTPGQFVCVTGAVGNDGARVIYSKDITSLPKP